MKFIALLLAALLVAFVAATSTDSAVEKIDFNEEVEEVDHEYERALSNQKQCVIR